MYGQCTGIKKARFFCILQHSALKNSAGLVYFFWSFIANGEQCSLSLSPSFASAFLSSSAVSTASSSISSATSSTSLSTISPASNQIPVVEALQKPNNDCEALQPLYTIKTIDGKTINAQFDISCNTDFVGGSFIEFYSPSLTTCIQGCALFNYWQTKNTVSTNPNCSDVTYWPEIVENGNCWLNTSGYPSVASRKNNSAYAKLRLNNAS